MGARNREKISKDRELYVGGRRKIKQGKKQASRRGGATNLQRRVEVSITILSEREKESSKHGREGTLFFQAQQTNAG